jgi:hypothetical protein
MRRSDVFFLPGEIALSGEGISIIRFFKGALNGEEVP